MDEARIKRFLEVLATRPACPDCGDPQWAACCAIARGEVLDRLDDDPRWLGVQSVLSRGQAALSELSNAEWQLVVYHARGRVARHTRRTVVEVRDRLAILVRDLDGLLGQWPQEGDDAAQK